jgi:hypothetical protein
VSRTRTRHSCMDQIVQFTSHCHEMCAVGVNALNKLTSEADLFSESRKLAWWRGLFMLHGWDNNVLP